MNNAVLREYARAARRAQGKLETDQLPRPIVGENRIKWIEKIIQVFHPEERRAVPLVCNPMQRDIILGITDREIVLKSRRAGLTTIFVADAWIDLITTPGTKVELFAHDLDTAQAVFEQIVRFQYEHMPDWIRPEATTDNVRELKFKDTDCSFRVLTAGQSEQVAMKKGQARVITHLLMTEFAFYAYAEDLYSRVVNCVPVQGGKVRIDSTPNGQNSFYRRFREGREGLGVYKARFYPWWWDNMNRQPVAEDEVVEPDESELGRLTLRKGDERVPLVSEYGNPAEGERIEALDLTPAQLKFRREKIAGLQPKGTLTARDVFGVEYPEDDDSCFLHSGRPVFLAKALIQKATLRDAIEGHKHSIGHDASTGDATGHPSGCSVIDVDTGEQVYEWRGWEPTDSQAERLVELQRRYPGVIIVERNYPGDSVLMLLRRWAIKNIYKHRDKDLREGVSIKAYKRKPGFPMSDLTKPRLFTDLDLAINNGDLLLAGKKTIDDLKGYQYNDTDRIEFVGSAEHHREAGEFSHGELGVATALAWWGRKTGSIGVG